MSCLAASSLDVVHDSNVQRHARESIGGEEAFTPLILRAFDSLATRALEFDKASRHIELGRKETIFVKIFPFKM